MVFLSPLLLLLLSILLPPSGPVKQSKKGLNSEQDRPLLVVFPYRKLPRLFLSFCLSVIHPLFFPPAALQRWL